MIEWTRVGSLQELANVEGRSLWLSAIDITDLTPLAIRPDLEGLRIEDCSSLRTLDGIDRLTALRELIVTRCPELESIAALRGLLSLRTLRLVENHKLASLDGLEGAPHLERLRVLSCAAVRDVSALAAVPDLRVLDLSSCPLLERVDAVAMLHHLESLELSWTRIESLPPLPNTLRRLSLTETPLQSIACAFPCTELHDLRFDRTAVRDAEEVARVLAHPKLVEIALPVEVVPFRRGSSPTGFVAQGTEEIESLRRILAPGIGDRSRRWVGLAGPPHEIELFRRVVANPCDREARRAYAAELCRAGEPRGEYIALETATVDNLALPPSERARTLYAEHAVEWFSEVRRLVDETGVHGGFVESVYMNVRSATRHGADLVARTPLRRLTLEGARWPGDDDGLFATSWTEHLEALTWEVAFAKDLVALGASRHVRNVTRLWLSRAQLSVAAAQSLASGSLPALRELRLYTHSAEPGAFEPLAALPLTTLEICGNGLYGVLPAIARSPAMSSLRVLRIAGWHGDDSDTLEVLADSPHLGALEEIGLGTIDDPSGSYYPRALFHAPRLHSLKLVTASASWATDPSGDRTIETPHGPATFRVSPNSQYY